MKKAFVLMLSLSSSHRNVVVEGARRVIVKLYSISVLRSEYAALTIPSWIQDRAMFEHTGLCDVRLDQAMEASMDCDVCSAVIVESDNDGRDTVKFAVLRRYLLKVIVTVD